MQAGRKTAQGFKIAYQSPHKTTAKDFDLFCQIAWDMDNGRHKKALMIICEEVAEHSDTTGYHGKLLRLGRKFNLETINIFQSAKKWVKPLLITAIEHA